MFSLNEIKGLNGKKWEKFKNTLLTLSLAVTAGSLMQNLKLLSGNLCTASAKRIYKTADCPHIIIRFLLSLKENEKQPHSCQLFTQMARLAGSYSDAG